MAAIDVSNQLNKQRTEELYLLTKKYGSVVLAKYLVDFDTAGAPTWNEVIGLWSQTVRFYSAASVIVIDQDASTLQANWLIVSGMDVPTIRADFVALGAELVSLMNLIESNDGLISQSLNRSASSVVYDALNNGQKNAIKTQLDSISALIAS